MRVIKLYFKRSIKGSLGVILCIIQMKIKFKQLWGTFINFSNLKLNHISLTHCMS